MPELIDKGSCSDAHPTPLLFVHGAWHAAWCWDEHFLDFFADNGYRALALSLRGHGGSSASEAAASISIADYVDDVVAVAQGLPTPPVVIGHSMGQLRRTEVSREASGGRRRIARVDPLPGELAHS